MRWPWLVEAWTARLLADPALLQLLGGRHLYAMGSTRAIRIPSVQYLVVTDREEETFAPVRVQVDCWARTLSLEAQIERRIRALTHRNVFQMLEGERVLMRYMDGRTMPSPRAGVVHRSLDFELEAVRRAA